MQIDHQKSREIFAVSSTRDHPKIKTLFKNGSSLRGEAFPFFFHPRKLPLCPTPVQRQRGQTAAMLSFFISPRYPSHHGSPRETEKRRDGLKRQVNESSTRSSSRKGIQRLLFECIHLGISIRVANHRKLHSSSFTLCVCVYL